MNAPYPPPVINESDDPILQDVDSANNLVELFLKRADEKGGAPFLGRKSDGEWTTQSWAEVADIVCLLAESLRRIGLNAGDRVALVSENRPEWCIADLAIMAAGCISVPTYTTNTERDHEFMTAVALEMGSMACPSEELLIRTGESAHNMYIVRRGLVGCHGLCLAARARAPEAMRRVRSPHRTSSAPSALPTHSPFVGCMPRRPRVPPGEVPRRGHDPGLRRQAQLPCKLLDVCRRDGAVVRQAARSA